MTRAYSYQRFSSPEQMKGDSLRRQTEAAQKYADEHGLELDTELTFQDLGVSAYRGANFEAALGRFIEAVDSGRVPNGSYLLVENLDRLSRDKIMPALNRFQSLLEKRIIVVTLADGKRYDADSLNNLPDLMLSLLVMSRAHEESQTKSKRGREAWKQLKAKAASEGRKISTAAPAWLSLDGDKWKVDQAKARTVKRVFELALEGHSQASITSRFNREKVSPIGSSDAWSQAYIRSILRNHAVIGTFQPHRNIPGSSKREPEGNPIEGYFPAIIDKATFYKVQRLPKGASGKKGRVLTNVLAGLLHCGLCGGSVHYLNKGGNRRAYVHCDNAKRKFTCDAKAMHFDTVLQYVLDQVDLPTPWLLGQEQQDRQQRAREQLEVIEAKITEIEGRNANLVANLELAPSQALAEKLAQNEKSISTFQTWIENLTNRLNDLGQNDHQWEETRAAVEEFNRVMTSDDQEKIGAIRVRLNASLKKLIERVEVGPDGVNVIAKGSLPVPELERRVAKDGSFTFVAD